MRGLIAVVVMLAGAVAHAQELEAPPDWDPPGLPVAPRRAESPMRGGLEIAVGWRHAGAGAGVPVAIGVGLGVDRFVGRRLALGGRLGYLAGAAADEAGGSFAAFDGGARLRWGLVEWRRSDRKQLELELGVGFRLGSAGASAGTATLGVNASLGLMRFGVRYVRALDSGGAADDLVLGVVEWMTPAVYEQGGTYRERSKRSGPRIGLGTHLIVGGYGLGALGPQLPGLALELAIHLGGLWALAPRWDLAWFPLADGGSVVVDTALLDLWWVPSEESPVGFIGGVGWAASHAGSGEARAGGVVGDLGFFYVPSWAGLMLGLQARAGLTAEGEDLRAVFVTIGGRQIFR